MEKKIVGLAMEKKILGLANIIFVMAGLGVGV
jgi:hypothetical protein